MSRMIFAANWKMHIGPEEARRFLPDFLKHFPPQNDREVWFFPSAISLEAVIEQVRDRPDIKVGVQNVHWEPRGAFTGELAVGMAREAGAQAALVGHSERRHVFGESDDETGLKVRAVLAEGITPMLCVGEKIEQREAGETVEVVERQLSALQGLGAEVLSVVPIAYEPVWAIGTGKTATPADAAEVHGAIRAWLEAKGVPSEDVCILYGGSVNPENVGSLVSERDVHGVLVGGASLEPTKWARIARVDVD